MTLTVELDLDGVMANQRAKYLGQRSFSSKFVRTHTYQADCFTWISEMGGKYSHCYISREA